MARTLKELAQEAQRVQGACNLTAVLHGFARASSDLRELLGDWDEAARHPIMVAWTDKVASLTGCQRLGDEKAMTAHREVGQLAAGEAA